MDMSVTGAQRRRDVCEPDDVIEPPPPAPKPVTRGVQAHVDRGIADAARNAKPAGDGVLYLGMNSDSNGVELRALQAATHGNVTAVMAHHGAEIDTKFGKFDLRDDAQVDAFCKGMVAHYGLTAAQGDKVRTTLLGITGSDAAARDEVGRLALYFARGDVGQGAMPSRIVLSGHSGGTQLWGKDDGVLLAAIRTLGQTFPRAALQVEDIHFASCTSMSQLQQDESWRNAFPNLKTMWGYDGFSPSAPVGHLLGWRPRRADTRRSARDWSRRTQTRRRGPRTRGSSLQASAWAISGLPSARPTPVSTTTRPARSRFMIPTTEARRTTTSPIAGCPGEPTCRPPSAERPIITRRRCSARASTKGAFVRNSRRRTAPTSAARTRSWASQRQILPT